jgi:hypothetical protein
VKDAKGHGSDPRGAHSEGINAIGKPTLPLAPGLAPIPPGNVRLYHQTSEENLAGIMQNGLELSKAKGIEGPKAIYADEKGFYGDPATHPTVEFSIPKERWNPPFVRADSVLDQSRVAPSSIIAVHYPWQEHARYAESHPDVKAAILRGEHDSLLSDKEYGPTIRYIKARYAP